MSWVGREAALTVWGVVNAVNLLQTAGFLSRVFTGAMDVNHALGYALMALAVPAVAAIAVFVRVRAGWRQWVGPAVYVAFVVLMIVVEDVLAVEFRDPPRQEILVPYLVLFFASIVLMGAPMFRMHRRLWLVTVATTTLLLASMGLAMGMGVG